MSDYKECPHAWVQIEHDRQEGSRGTNEVTVLECAKCFARHTIEEFRKTPEAVGAVQQPGFLVHSKETVVRLRRVRVQADNAEEAARKVNRLVASEGAAGEIVSVSREVGLDRIDLPEDPSEP